MKRWQLDVSPAVGTPQIIEVPEGVGQVRVIHDFTAGGSGTVAATYDTVANALADTPYAWTAVITAGVADADTDVLDKHVQAVKLTSTTTVQRFVLVGETSGD